MKIGLHDADKENRRKLCKIFPNNPDFPPNTIEGGTGCGLFSELPPETEETLEPVQHLFAHIFSANFADNCVKTP